MIQNDCHMLGVILDPIKDPIFPRFTLPLRKINYTNLIAKALYFSLRDQEERIRLSKEERSSSKMTSESLNLRTPTKRSNVGEAFNSFES